MNTYIKLILGIIFILGVTSCEDAYNIDKPGAINEEVTFEKADDLQLYLNGIYSYANNLSEIKFTSVFTDELAPTTGYNGEFRGLHRFTLNSTTGYASSIWLKNYFTINRVNRLVDAVKYISDLEENQGKVNDILAQGRLLRANAYLQLLSFYSTNMKDGNALGVIIVNGIPTTGDLLKRSTNAEVFAEIEKDLNYAKNNLSNSNNFNFPTKYAAEALLARMYAYKGDYAKAKIHASSVINNSGITLSVATPFDESDFYTTSTSNPYRQVWADTNQGEQIFSLKSEATGSGFGLVSLYYFNNSSFNGSPKWGMGHNLYAKLKEVPGDIRFKAFVDPSTDVEKGRLMIDKYPGIPNSPLRNNVKLVRLSEMYFFLAEAAVDEPNLNKAAEYVHEIQKARNYETAPALPTYSSQQDAWGAILDERRKEFAFEGFRYIDLRRLGALGNRSIDRSDSDDESSGMPLTLDINDHRFTLPIPLDEINPNTGIQQNPGY